MGSDEIRPVLEYLRSVATLAPLLTGAGIGWGLCMFFKKERIEILESRAKEIEALRGELRETRKRTDVLTELLNDERKASANIRAEHSSKHIHCSICGGPVKKTAEGKGQSGWSYVILTCEPCQHEFRVSAEGLASRI